MSIHIKKYFYQFILRILTSIVWVKKTVFNLVRIVALKPLKTVAFFILQKFLVRFYRNYLIASKKIKDAWLPSKSKFLYFFSGKYIAHVVMIILLLIVTSNNIFARNITGDTAGKDSILYAMVSQDAEGEIVETDETQRIQSVSSLEQGSTIARQTLESTTEESNEQTNITEGGALVKGNPTETDEQTKERNKALTHKVAEGETISQIAAQYRISTATLLYANNLTDGDIIKPGQDLTVPPFTGVYHKVAKGQTLDAIAEKYNVDKEKIIDYNKLVSADQITEGETLSIPDAEVPEITRPQEPAPKKRSGLAIIKDFFTAPPAPKSTGGGWLWPTNSRKINQYFTWRHTGVDLDGDTGDPIKAALDGVVESVGWNGGYGKSIVIRHSNGDRSRYGHLSAYAVTDGQGVSKGQIIGKMGSTGWSTGAHLHFEIIRNGRVINPLGYIK